MTIRICAPLLLLLSACGVSAPSEHVAGAVMPVAAEGASCAGIYGDPPQPLTSSATAVPQVLVDALRECTITGGELLNWTDANGTPREACLRVPANASASTRLPLVVFLQGSVFPAQPQTLISGWDLLNGGSDLSGDPARPGFILLTPYGRDYPARLSVSRRYRSRLG